VDSQGTNLHYNNNPGINQDWRIAPASSYGHFPKEYQRNLIEALDKRFLMIWMLSFIVHFTIALYFSMNPPAAGFERSEIDRIQKQYATFVLDKAIEQAPVEPDRLADEQLVSEKTSLSSSVQGKGGSGTTGRSQSAPGTNSSNGYSTDARYIGSASGAEQRLSSREQISQEVSSKGLLGLLTGSGSNAKGEAISDALGDAAGTQGDLDKVLGNLAGLKSSGKATVGTAANPEKGRITQKGTRSIETGAIDELIAGKGQASSTEIQRTGNIVVEQVSEIADERGIKSESRDADRVSEVVNRHNSSIQYCYQRELKQYPDLKGKLVVRFTIGTDGKIKDVKVISSTLNSPSIERCVISRIKRWDDFGAIDPSRGEATFRQVYTFGY